MSRILAAILMGMAGSMGQLPTRIENLEMGRKYPHRWIFEKPEWFTTKAGGRMQANGVKKARNQKGRKR